MLATLKNLGPLLIYSLGIILFLLSLSGKVKYGLLFLVPLIPLQNVIEKLQAFPMGKDLNDLLLMGLIIGWIITTSSKREPIFQKTSFNMILFLYILFTYFSLWHGSSFLGLPAPLSTLDPRVQNWKNYVTLPLLFLLAFNNLKDTKEIKRLFIFMCLSILLMNFYTVRQVGDMTSWASRTKLSGTFVWLGANEVAAFYATYTFVLLGVFLTTKGKWLKLLLGVLILTNLYCDLFCFSRGAYLATLMAFLLIGIVRNKIFIIPVVIILIFWQSILPQKVIERIKYTEHEGELDISAQKRLDFWQESLEYFKSSPITGVGFNVVSQVGEKRDTHNLYIRTLAEEGIIGFFFLVFIMFLALKRGIRLYQKTKDPFLKGLGLGFSGAVTAVMVGNMFGDRWTPLPLAAYFWVFLGMVERGNLITNAA